MDFDEQGQPTTKNGRQWQKRGIQPFQNFPAGSVMWGSEDWKMHIAQLPKMGMNFIGLHTYMSDPEDDHVGDYGPNLNVWIGHENDLNMDGSVDLPMMLLFSYPSANHWMGKDQYFRAKRRSQSVISIRWIPLRDHW